MMKMSEALGTVRAMVPVCRLRITCTSLLFLVQLQLNIRLVVIYVWLAFCMLLRAGFVCLALISTPAPLVVSPTCDMLKCLLPE